jgi:SOS-response transcriptional repressor LexA
LTGTQLAAISGISQPYISALECGKREPSREILIVLARALDTTAAYLLGETDVSLPNETTRKLDFTDRVVWVPVLNHRLDFCDKNSNIFKNLDQIALYKYPIFDEAVADLKENADLYLIPVNNSSMKPDIAEGDLILFDRKASWSTGNIVIAYYNGNLTVRGIIQQQEKIVLRARNWQEYKDIRITTDDKFFIVGVVIFAVPSIKKIKSIL